MRRMSEQEQSQYTEAVRAMANAGDSIIPRLRPTYYVSFDLEDALKNPGGNNDLVLREGDVLELPLCNNTVRINGAVQVPSTITYRPGLSKKDLVDAAGGYIKRAYKRKAFIVYMNGRVSRMKFSTKIEPGCQVYIPIKEKKTANISNIMSYATMTTSLGMMGVSIANMLK